MTTHTTSAGVVCRSTAIAGRAMLAIAVSNADIAMAIKTTAAAQRRWAGGRPSGANGLAFVMRYEISVIRSFSGGCRVAALSPWEGAHAWRADRPQCKSTKCDRECAFERQVSS